MNIPNLLLVNAKPSLNGKGIILHFRETEGDHAILDINKLISDTNAKSISEVTVLEEIIEELNTPILFEHFETKFIYIEI
jgi:alpha-mannosidase